MGKKRHTVKSLVVRNHQRHVLFVSPLFGGSVHDYVMLTDLFDPDLPWFENLTVRSHKKPRKSKKNPFQKLTSDQKQDTEHTNHIERFNCTLRQRISRLVRKTLSFSKKLINHIGAIRHFIHHYNAFLPVNQIT